MVTRKVVLSIDLGGDIRVADNTGVNVGPRECVTTVGEEVGFKEGPEEEVQQREGSTMAPVCQHLPKKTKRLP